jgi:hypothetical protein
MSPLIVTSELRGPVDLGAARAWRHGLHAAITGLPPGSVVRLLVDQTGYRPAGLKVHRQVRTVVPEVLAAHGLFPALADLFPGVEVTVAPDPAVRIEACAVVHHDRFKMDELDRRVGRPSQRFFTDAVAARAWLRSWPGRTGADAPTPPEGTS